MVSITHWLQSLMANLKNYKTSIGYMGIYYVISCDFLLIYSLHMILGLIWSLNSECDENSWKQRGRACIYLVVAAGTKINSSFYINTAVELLNTKILCLCDCQNFEKTQHETLDLASAREDFTT
ncbi:hypothetical protein ACJX0J_030799, partial [Zea mays]